jgi:N-acetylglucosamine-6-sulfatase
METLEGITPPEPIPQEVTPTRDYKFRKLKAAIAVSAIALTICISASGVGHETDESSHLTIESVTSHQTQERPNIVVVQTDDESMNLAPYRPFINHYFKKHGVDFTNSFVGQSLCCSSRTSKYTGLLPHNDHVISNNYPDGGFWPFHKYDEKSTFPVWLQKSNYTTSEFGKFLNQYPHEPGVKGHRVSNDYIPKGFSEFVSPVKGRPYKERNYGLNVNGTVDKRLRHKYMVRVLDRMGQNFIRQHADEAEPFELEIDPYADHAPYKDENRFRGKFFSNIKYPRTPAYDEANISDKTSLLRLLPPERHSKNQLINHVFDKRIGAEMGVDRMFRHLVHALTETGEIENTYIIYTSDNGYHMGEHRMGIGKNTPYDTDTQVPLFVAGPGIKPGRTINQLVGNIDLASTIAAMAGVTPPQNVDGRSFFALLKGKHHRPWRKYFLTERGKDEYYTPHSNSIAEPADPIDEMNARYQTEPYEAVRWVGKKPGLYVEYVDGAREFYDMTSDPYQNHNLLAPGVTLTNSQAHELAKASAALDQLKNCQGNTGPESCFVTNEQANKLLANR